MAAQIAVPRALGRLLARPCQSAFRQRKLSRRVTFGQLGWRQSAFGWRTPTCPNAVQYNRPQQKCLHARGENLVSRRDGVLAVAQLVRQADLPQIGMDIGLAHSR